MRARSVRFAAFVALSAVFVAVACPAPALARPGATGDQTSSVTDDAAAPPLLELALVGQLPEADALESRILSWFRGLPTLTETGRLDALDPAAVFAAHERPGVRVWVLSRSAQLVRLFFAVEGTTSGTPRYLVRDVTLDSGLDELGMEQVAQVVYLSSLGLWSGQLESSRRDVEVGLGLVEQPAVLPPVSDRSEPDARLLRADRPRWSIGFEYSGRYAGAEGLSHGPGASLALAFPAGALAWGPHFHAQLLLPHRAESERLGLQLRGASFGLGLGGALATGDHDAVTAEVGAGLDAVRFRVLVLPEPSWRASSSALDWRPFAFLRFGMQSQVGFAKVGAAALLSLPLVRTHYDLADEGVRREVLVPWLLQPGFAISVTW